MSTPVSDNHDKSHHFLAAIGSHPVWLYFRFCLSYWDMEALPFVFKSSGHAQRFFAAYGPLAQRFRPRRYRFSAPEYRQVMVQRCQIWQEMIGTVTAAEGLDEGLPSYLSG
jgi:hypothetical protein